MLPARIATTWKEFQSAFRAQHIPLGLMDQKKKEFCKLRQGKTTIDEYHRKFIELSCYARDEIGTDARKQERFHEELHPDIKVCDAHGQFQSEQFLLGNSC